MTQHECVSSVAQFEHQTGKIRSATRRTHAASATVAARSSVYIMAERGVQHSA